MSWREASACAKAMLIVIATVLVVNIGIAYVENNLFSTTLVGTWRGSCEGSSNPVQVEFLQDGTVKLPDNFSGQWTQQSDGQMTILAPFVGMQSVSYSISGNTLTWTGGPMVGTCTFTRAQ